MDEKLTYASLFSAGGLGCYGFKAEGYDCVATAELISRRLEVQKANKTCSDDASYYLADLSNAETVHRIAEEVGSRTNDLTFVIATPPCQGMSVANHKKRNEIDRNSLVVNSLTFIELTTPRFFVIENVRSFLNTACVDTDETIKSIEEAINHHLGGSYNIYSKVVNLKEIGSPSSRTRTLVIGTRNDLLDVTPADLYPPKTVPPTLRELIGHLESLKEMGQISDTDIYHSFRSYDPRMKPWIENTPEGASAFQNEAPEHRPHRIVNGNRVENKNKNGDKYKRNEWDKTAPCVHTRNDILASQSTVHPVDDRVFSIRELSLMMGLPNHFQWSPFTLETLNSLPIDQKQTYLKEHDVNIRQCLGEGVPTPVFQAIARRAREIIKMGFSNTESLRIKHEEKQNPFQKSLAAYYTRQSVTFSLMKYIRIKKKTVRVLEPSAGAGAFVQSLLTHLQDKNLEIHLNDIDSKLFEQRDTLETLAFNHPQASIHITSNDFLSNTFQGQYDVIIGNPPFGSSGKYHGELKLKDLFARFLEKSAHLADWIAFVLPKSFLSGREFQSLREYMLEHFNIVAIEDYGEKAFGSIKIETIGVVFHRRTPCASADNDRAVTIKSYLFNTIESKALSQVVDERFPSWLLYRNAFFEAVAEQLELDTFQVYRDRVLTKKNLSTVNGTSVYRGRDIGLGTLGEPTWYCSAQQIPESFRTKQDSRTLLIAPNLSYYTRSAILPRDTYADGSAAVLIPKKQFDVSRAMRFFCSSDFFYFYRIARNYSVRSLNIDSLSVFWWGTPRPDYRPICSEERKEISSKHIFRQPPI